VKRLLVTGADGFVGRWLVRAALEQGWHVTAVTGPGGAPPARWLARGAETVTTFEADLDSLADITRIAKAPADAVVHLAAVASGAAAREDPEAAMRINSQASVMLLLQLHELGRGPRLLMVSTGEVYGPGHDGPIGEEVPRHPVSPYAASKAAAEIAIEDLAPAMGLDVITVRPFTHTGPGQLPRYVLPAMVARLAEARRTGAREVPMGNLDVIRDFLDVRDVVRAYLLLLEHGASGAVYNVASGVGQHLGQTFTRLAALMQVDAAAVTDPALARPADIPVLIGDPSRLAAATGWAPAIPFDQTLRDLVDAQAD
jgi:GDP-4-dehydro-6-deoxy-D-mannose reductase